MRDSKILVFILSFLTAFGLSLVLAPSTFASDLSLNVDVSTAGSVSVQYCTDYVSDSSATKHAYCFSEQNKYWTTTGSNRLENLNKFNFSISGIRISPYITIDAGRIVVFQFFLNNMKLNDSQDTTVVGLKCFNDNVCDVLSVDFNNLDNTSAQINLVVRFKQSISVGHWATFVSAASPPNVVGSNSLFGYNFLWTNGQFNAGIMGGTMTIYKWRDGFDDTSILNAIRNMPNYTTTLNGISNDLDAFVQSQNEANNQAQQRFEEEKNTINNSVNDANSDANSMDTSGFHLSNPLSSWLSMFTNENCVDIPKLASWLNSQETRVCSPWSADVRSNLTPIISVLSLTVGFGLLVHWLKGSSDVGLENS